MPFLIRPIREDDAPAYIDLLRALDAETKFMMFEPGERKTTLEEQQKRIRTTLAADNAMLFLVEKTPEPGQPGPMLVGVLGAQGGTFQRNHHTVHIFIGIRQAFTGQGLGRRLFEEMEAWARSWGAHRLELTVMANNPRGLALYQKMGFTIEGRLKDRIKVDGEYIDELQMSKILE